MGMESGGYQEKKNVITLTLETLLSHLSAYMFHQNTPLAATFSYFIKGS